MDQIIPLLNTPNSTMTVGLSIDGGTVVVQLTVGFNIAAGYWVMTVRNSYGALLIDSIPLLTGDWPSANVLGQQAYLGIGSAFVINSGSIPQDYPDDQNGFGTGGPFLFLWSNTPTG